VTADLAAWLLADDGPIAEDERVAQAALARTRRWPKGDRPWERAAFRASIEPGPAGVLERMAAFGDPDRVLAECDAKRKIIEHHCPANPEDPPGDRHCLGCADMLPCPTLMYLAQPYAGRPGWREEWGT
jgi:hypothetical protein